MIEDLLKKNRSYRRFHEDRKISEEALKYLVNLTRLAPSVANLQPLKYYLSADDETNGLVFSTLGWAGHLNDWGGPQEGERPSAYIIILCDRELRKECGFEPGIVAQSIMLGATEKGIGGCMINSIRREELRSALDLPNRFDILLVLALGYPKEAIVLEDALDSNIHYYHDTENIHHVPKRPLDELILD